MLTELINQSLKQVKSNSTTILTVTGVVGTVTTAVYAARAGWESQYMWDGQLETDLTEDLSPRRQKWELTKTYVKACGKLYIPAGISATLTITSVVYLNRVHSQRAAAYVAAYSLAERGYHEYKEAVKDAVGEDEEKRIRDRVAQKRVDETRPKEAIIVSPGLVMTCELYTGRYFQCSMEKLRKLEVEVNHRLVQGHTVSLSDFYYELGLEETQESDNVGWDDGRLLELEFTTTLGPQSTPCLAFGYNYTKLLK